MSTIEEQRRLAGKPHQFHTLADLLALPGVEDVELNPPPLQGPLSRFRDLT